MTTKFLDNKIFTFKILLSWRFPRKKTSVFGRFPLCPQGPPPLHSENFIFIVASPSLRYVYVTVPKIQLSKEMGCCNVMGEAFLLTVGALLLTVKLLCLQSLNALIRRTFPL